MMAIGTSSQDGASPPRRRYDKGERRYRHVGRGSEPTIEVSPRRPKERIGKCPKTLTAAQHEQLANEAIPAPNGNRDLDVPKRLYVVHGGAIYELQTTDLGVSYHGYPYHGRLSKDLITQLRTMATEKNCEREFSHWLKQHIEVHGV